MVLNSSGRLAAFIAAVFAAAPALAEETVFPATGGGGDVAYNLNCDPGQGQYLVGIKGGQGAWLDRVGIICKPMGPRRVPEGPLVEVDQTAGGGGGGAYHKFCRENYFIGGYSVQLTQDNKRVQVLRLYCMSNDEANWPKYTMAAGSEAPGGRTFENYCPPGQIGSGLHGRSGKDINSAALICRTIVAPAAPARPEKPVKTLHHPPRPPAAAPPPPAPPPPAPPEPPAPPPPPQAAQVRAIDDVDIYDGPGGEYHVIGMMEKDATAPQVGRQEGWCKLGGVANGQDGWVADDHLDGCQ